MSAEGVVLDASAALAFIQDEPGHDAVSEAFRAGASISAVNLAEVHSTLISQRVASDGIVARLKAMGLAVEPFEEADASAVGALREKTVKLGLSLADRACLALGLRLGRPVLTTDVALSEARVGIDVTLIR